MSSFQVYYINGKITALSPKNSHMVGFIWKRNVLFVVVRASDGSPGGAVPEGWSGNGRADVATRRVAPLFKIKKSDGKIPSDKFGINRLMVYIIDSVSLITKNMIAPTATIAKPTLAEMRRIDFFLPSNDPSDNAWLIIPP